MPKSNNNMEDTKLITIEDEQPSLEKTQELVGGLVELITLNNGDQMLVNEEGLLKDLPENEQATYLVMHMSNVACVYGIRGNAVLLKGSARWS